MKNKIITIFVITILFLTFSLNARNNEPYRTGLKMPSKEQLEWMKKNYHKIHKIIPNKLFYKRLQESMQRNGLKMDTAKETPSAFGEEIVSSPGKDFKKHSHTFKSEQPLRTLPSSVDNSTLSCFPPIRTQGSIGSCTCFATTYYQFTHMMGLLRGWNNNNDDNTTKFSPRWTYSLINNGEDNGSGIGDAYDVLTKHGSVRWSEFPYNTSGAVSSNYRKWCMDTQAWKNALCDRIQDTGYISSVTNLSNHNQLKQLLANGYVVVIGTYINSWNYLTITNDPGTTADDPYVGKKACYWANGYSGGHAMTVVGYNDDIWIDINRNGVLDSGEKGAFRIANSWGTGWSPDGVNDNGFVWFAYDAVRGRSAVSGAPSTGRTDGWSGVMAFWMTTKKEYTPTLIAQFTLNNAQRNQLLLRLGTANQNLLTPTFQWYPEVFYDSGMGSGGPYAFDGTTTAIDGTFVLDYSEIIQSDSSYYYLYVEDSTAGNDTAVKSFDLIYYATGDTVSYTSLPVVFDDDYIWMSVQGDITPPLTKASLESGIYIGEKRVTLTAVDPESGVECIYYTTDGSDPLSSSSIQSGSTPVSVTINKSTILKYYAVNGAGLKEDVQTKQYTDYKEPKDKIGVYNTHCNLSHNESVKIVINHTDKYIIRIYNLSGLLVQEYEETHYNAGTVLTWFGTQQNTGDAVTAGIYVVSVRSENMDKTFKVIITK